VTKDFIFFKLQDTDMLKLIIRDVEQKRRLLHSSPWLRPGLMWKEKTKAQGRNQDFAEEA